MLSERKALLVSSGLSAMILLTILIDLIDASLQPCPGIKREEKHPRVAKIGIRQSHPVCQKLSPAHNLLTFVYLQPVAHYKGQLVGGQGGSMEGGQKQRESRAGEGWRELRNMKSARGSRHQGSGAASSLVAPRAWVVMESKHMGPGPPRGG